MGSFSKSVVATNCLVLIILYPIVSAVFSRAGQIIFGETLTQTQPWIYHVYSYLPILFLLVFYVYATLEPLDHYGITFEKKYAWLSVSIGVISAVVLYIVDVQAGVFEAFQVPANPGFLAVVGFIFAWGVLGPLAEELLFRGIIQSTLARTYDHTWIAISGTVGLEIVMHAGLFTGGFSGWAMLGYVTVFSTAASVIYARTQSLFGPIMIHAIGNAGELVLYWIIT